MHSPQTLSNLPPASAWKKERDGLYSALVLLGLSRQAEKVLQCGNAVARYHCAECGHDIDLALSCDNRLCPRCGIRRAARFIRTHQATLQAMTQPKLLTLTYASTPELTKKNLKRYTATFAQLRRRRLWKDRVRGGIASLEFTVKPVGWHPHWHALIDADYIPQAQLSRLWHSITRDSYIVYIQAANKHSSVYEVAKYVAKGSFFYSQPHLVNQYLAHTYRRRFFVAFGTFYNTAEQPPPPPWRTKPIDTSNLVNPPPPHLPLITTCPYCTGTSLTFIGQAELEHIEPPPVQMPF